MISDGEPEDDEKIAGKGHNRIGGMDNERFKSLVQRFEKLDEEKSAIADDQRDLMQEVKAQGFDTKLFKQIIKLRAINADERDRQFYILDTYARALGFSILDLDE